MYSDFDLGSGQFFFSAMPIFMMLFFIVFFGIIIFIVVKGISQWNRNNNFADGRIDVNI